MKIALVQAPVWWTIDPPLGLAQIAGCAKAAGHEVSVLDLNIVLWKNRLPKYESMWLWEQFHFWNNPEIVRQFFRDNSLIIEDQIERLLRSDARVIGLSVYLGAHWASLELSRMIRKADPRRIIVWGGQFFFKGNVAQEWIQHPEIDAIVRGHGDVVFPELLKTLEAGGLKPIAGVVCKAGDGGPAPAIKDLDSVPFADIAGFPLETYTDVIRIPFAGSRGCVWKCHFCSSTQFWAGYTYMSGERMFAEVSHQKKLFPWKSHVDFYDITANGSVESLLKFSELSHQFHQERKEKAYGWKINGIIRPEMTRDVLQKMKLSGCQDIIYGIESGSPRVLALMNKPYRIDVAEKVLADTHAAGIKCTGNFMFGFPGETEEDFQRTLEFVRRNHESLDRVYASATFTSLEEHSHLTSNPRALGVKEVHPDRFHNLYWESEDGTNDYEVRLDRYKRFRELSIALGIDAYKGVNGKLEQDQLANLAQYKQFKSDHLAAIDHFLRYLEFDLYNGPMRDQLAAYGPEVRALLRAQRAIEKTNAVLAAEPGLAEELVSWAVPHLNNGGMPPLGPERGLAWHRASRLLGQARRWLMTMPPERRAGIHPRDGRFALIWIEKDVPPYSRLKAVVERIDMILGLAEGEITRGEDKKEPPRCQR